MIPPRLDWQPFAVGLSVLFATHPTKRASEAYIYPHERGYTASYFGPAYLIGGGLIRGSDGKPIVFATAEEAERAAEAAVAPSVGGARGEWQAGK